MKYRSLSHLFRTSKKEKKTINSVAPSASNDDVCLFLSIKSSQSKFQIEEQSSMHSNGSTSDSNSQQPV
jgi:hypothetical protein